MWRSRYPEAPTARDHVFASISRDIRQFLIVSSGGCTRIDLPTDDLPDG